MELFLLLSIGMSIVAFISIALNQAPASTSITDHNFEPAFPLDAQLMASNSINTLKLEDQVISIEGMTQLTDMISESVEQPSTLLATAEL